jgi:hypothetical protein
MKPYKALYTCVSCRVQTWCWESEPGDPLYDEYLYRPICADCRDYKERIWLTTATYEQLLLVINYEWALATEVYPRYAMSAKEMYQRRLEGEDFSMYKTSWRKLCRRDGTSA